MLKTATHGVRTTLNLRLVGSRFAPLKSRRRHEVRFLDWAEPYEPRLRTDTCDQRPESPNFASASSVNGDMQIAIAGNIGAGKTTLTRLSAEHYRWEAHFERVDNNPYLDDFYTDMRRWAFNLQIFFLNNRFRQVKRIQESDKNVVQDRTIYEDAFIFATNLHPSGLGLKNRMYLFRDFLLFVFCAVSGAWTRLLILVPIRELKSDFCTCIPMRLFDNVAATPFGLRS